jgi:hypothetical protein
MKIYADGCYCGAATVAVRSKAVSEGR